MRREPVVDRWWKVPKGGGDPALRVGGPWMGRGSIHIATTLGKRCQEGSEEGSGRVVHTVHSPYGYG